MATRETVHRSPPAESTASTGAPLAHLVTRRSIAAQLHVLLQHLQQLSSFSVGYISYGRAAPLRAPLAAAAAAQERLRGGASGGKLGVERCCSVRQSAAAVIRPPPPLRALRCQPGDEAEACCGRRRCVCGVGVAAGVAGAVERADERILQVRGLRCGCAVSVRRGISMRRLNHGGGTWCWCAAAVASLRAYAARRLSSSAAATGLHRVTQSVERSHLNWWSLSWQPRICARHRRCPYLYMLTHP
eukprot:TRINITY_DN991_c0_g1_i1.p1 TRINITY_DN991_c0_g1~~TRINITY_DN991_c0_g1_i1.p1  ORF type:complete len:245 (+),score=44.97 TRINITY_DN991_c0_g1_i1:463-1197(+)